MGILMYRLIPILLPVLLLASCAMETREDQDRAACASQKADSFKHCMDERDQRRAEEDIQKMQDDLNEYERLKQDRLDQHLGF